MNPVHAAENTEALTNTHRMAFDRAAQKTQSQKQMKHSNENLIGLVTQSIPIKYMYPKAVHSRTFYFKKLKHN